MECGRSYSIMKLSDCMTRDVSMILLEMRLEAFEIGLFHSPSNSDQFTRSPEWFETNTPSSL